MLFYIFQTKCSYTYGESCKKSLCYTSLMDLVEGGWAQSGSGGSYPPTLRASPLKEPRTPAVRASLLKKSRAPAVSALPLKEPRTPAVRAPPLTGPRAPAVRVHPLTEPRAPADWICYHSCSNHFSAQQMFYIKYYCLIRAGHAVYFCRCVTASCCFIDASCVTEVFSQHFSPCHRHFVSLVILFHNTSKEKCSAS